MQWVERLLLGSFIVFAIQAMSGKGSLRPAVQLACACFMTILILEPLLERQISGSQLSTFIEDAEKQISQPIQSALHDMDIGLRDSIEAELETLLQTDGMSCQIRLVWDDGGALTGISYWANRAYAESIAAQLSVYTGLPSEKIQHIGEDTDGYS